jgi:hypothetical protein
MILGMVVTVDLLVGVEPLHLQSMVGKITSISLTLKTLMRQFLVL